MATKKLARTVVEGGRGGWSRYERRRLRRWQRAAWARRFDADGEPYYRKAPPCDTGREFADRLVPLRRWIESRVGRPWSETFSEFCRENDPRTIKGWHLLDHLRGYVSAPGFARRAPQWRDADFEVDADGVLRVGASYRWRYHGNYNQEVNRRARKRARRRNGSRR